MNLCTRLSSDICSTGRVLPPLSGCLLCRDIAVEHYCTFVNVKLPPSTFVPLTRVLRRDWRYRCFLVLSLATRPCPDSAVDTEVDHNRSVKSQEQE